MALRDLPHFDRGDKIPAKWGNDVSWNLSRLSRLTSSGQVPTDGSVIYDATPGRFGSAGGSSQVGTLIVGIEVVTFDDTYNIATCRITFRPPGVSTAAYEDTYGQIEVYDEMQGCLLADETEAELIGRRGTAMLMLADGSEDAYGETKWQMFTLCCPT